MSPEALTELRERWTGSRERLARMLDAMDFNMRGKHGHGLPPEVMALGDVFHPEAVVMGLLDALDGAEATAEHADETRATPAAENGTLVLGVVELRTDRDRLAARVLELEAPGECQSLHKLRAEVERVEAERDDALADSATDGWPRVVVCLECRAEVTTCDEDGAHSCGGYVIVCAGKDSAEQAIEFADVAEQNRIAVQEFTRWQRTGPRGCPPYESAIAGMLTRLDESFAALRTVEDTLRAERAELAAEVAAYQGRPEGALPGWARGPYTERGFERREGGTTMQTGGASGCRWMVARKGTADYDSGDATSPRAAMRAAESAARSRGWM